MNPKNAWPFILGMAGLIPFFFFALLHVLGLGVSLDATNMALIGYGAAILSFLGGAHWGAEISRQREAPNAVVLTIAMAPPMSGWAAILVYEVGFAAAAYGLLTAAFILQLLWDMTAIRSGFFPKWYLPLRILLTAGAVLSLLSAMLI